MKLIAESNLAEFSETFARYRQLSRRVSGDVLAHRSGRLSMRLYEEFGAVRPVVALIGSAAIARGFRVRRQGNSLTPTEDGLSRASQEAARTLLSGKKSDYFKVDTRDNIPRVSPARVGVRNASRILIGGRSGRKFAKTVRGLGELEQSERQTLLSRNARVKLLNFRALAVAIEIARRARSGRGGLLALQFLHSVYANRRSATVKSGPLISRTRGGIQIGSVVFESGGPEGDISAVNIKGTVPGSAKVAARHGVVDRAISAETADMKVYIQTKLTAAKQQAGLK